MTRDQLTSLGWGLFAITTGAAVGVGISLAARSVSDSDDSDATTTGGPPPTPPAPGPSPLAGAVGSAKGFWADVRTGMREREGELRVALGLDAAAAGARLDPKATHDLLDNPARWRAPTG